jgi:3-hydroxyisobutyrate dehydrogenase-like beta-hydroxyacid dehydrogenase
MRSVLIKEAAERSGLTKKKISQALADHTGSSPSENQFWHTVVEEKNTHVFHLNY